MRLYWISIVATPMALVGAYWFFGDPITEFARYRSPEWLTLGGTLLSYIGFATSLYAVIRIGELTKRNFARTRLPELQKSLNSICDQMSRFSGTGSKLMSEQFIASIPALSRSLKRINDADISKLADAVISTQELLVEWASSGVNKDTGVTSETRYWDLARKLNELLVEISERVKEENASR